MLYESEQDRNTVEVTKNIFFAGERWGCSTMTSWLKKFRSGCKKLDDLARLGRPKTEDSEAVLQVVEANPVRSDGRVSGEISSSLSSGVRHHHDLDKCRFVPHGTKIF